MHRARQPNRLSRVATTTAAAGCVLAIAACGSSGPSSSKTRYAYGAPNVPNSISRCMRANGVSGFPDPREGPDGGGVGFPGGLSFGTGSQISVEGRQFAGPAVLAAEKACKAYLPPAGPGSSLSESQRRQAIADAACMRRNGIPNFPDPTFSGGNQTLNLGVGINPNSPAFLRAAQACGLNRP